MKHEWRQDLTETVSSAGPGRPVSSQRIPSLHMCKQTAGTEQKQQLEPIVHEPEVRGHQDVNNTAFHLIYFHI